MAPVPLSLSSPYPHDLPDYNWGCSGGSAPETVSQSIWSNSLTHLICPLARHRARQGESWGKGGRERSCFPGSGMARAKERPYWQLLEQPEGVAAAVGNGDLEEEARGFPDRSKGHWQPGAGCRGRGPAGSQPSFSHRRENTSPEPHSALAADCSHFPSESQLLGSVLELQCGSGWRLTQHMEMVLRSSQTLGPFLLCSGLSWDAADSREPRWLLARICHLCAFQGT